MYKLSVRDPFLLREKWVDIAGVFGCPCCRLGALFCGDRPNPGFAFASSLDDLESMHSMSVSFFEIPSFYRCVEQR